MKYDGVRVKVIDTNERGDILLEVVEKAGWEDSPDVGAFFWVPSNDEYLQYP